MSIIADKPATPSRPSPRSRDETRGESRGEAAGHRRRGEGQWALGHREPLNPNERMKRDDDGLNARLRIEHVYAHRG
ncbi:MAG TPA: hypothetical protein VE132_05530, partial [Micromonosporaceae bacterium]|nr:hypothetical protein [Micromonosporaceae bacterium]